MQRLLSFDNPVAKSLNGATPAGLSEEPELHFNASGNVWTKTALACLLCAALPAFSQTRPLPGAVGTYVWTSDGKNVGKVTLNADGTCLNTNGSFRQAGVWTVSNAAKREINLNWNKGTFLDTVVVSADFRQIDGRNQKGNKIKGVREGGVSSATNTPTNQNGRVTPGPQDGTMPLSPRQVMVKGRKYFSASLGHYLIFQPDGNLVVNSATGEKVWSLDQVKPNPKAQKILVAPDGNFLALGPGDQYIWSALSADTDPRAWLDLNPAGALQLVSDSRGVLWSSDGKKGGAARNFAACTPYDRWTQCVAIPNPKIRIMATKAVSPAAIAMVKQIYSDMTAFLKPTYPKNKFDGFIVYITNGEPWSQLNGMGPIGPDLGANNSGDELRGGAARDYVWVSEQMICKTGVKTRGAKDKSARTYDQVVHEFAHSIDHNFGLGNRIKQLHAKSGAPGEDFAWDVQHWFSTPAGNMSDAERQFVGEIFSKQKTYSCDAYKP